MYHGCALFGTLGYTEGTPRQSRCGNQLVHFLTHSLWELSFFMTLLGGRAMGCGSVRSDMRALLGTLQWCIHKTGLYAHYLHPCMHKTGLQHAGNHSFRHRDLHRAVVLPLYWSLECSQRVRLLVTCPTLRKQVDWTPGECLCSGPNTTLGATAESTINQSRSFHRCTKTNEREPQEAVDHTPRKLHR